MLAVSVSEKKISHQDLDSLDDTTQLGNYAFNARKVIRRSFGKCMYAGWNKLSKIPVTVKIVDHNGALTKANSLINKHISDLKELENKNILSYHDSWASENKLYLIGEAVQETLDSFLARQQPLSQLQVVQIFSDVMLALQSIKQHPRMEYKFSPAHLFFQGTILKLDCLNFYQKYTSQASLTEIQKEESELQNLAILLNQLCLGLSDLKRQTSTQPTILRTLLKHCNQPLRYDIYSVSDLLRMVQVSPKSAKRPMDDKNKWMSRIDRVLLNQLNYVVFLQKLVQMLTQETSMIIRQDVQILVYLLRFHIGVIIHKLSKVKSQNPYKQQEWETYSLHQNFQTYIQVINQLFVAYQRPSLPRSQDRRFQMCISPDFSESEGFLLNYQYILRKFINKYKTAIKFTANSILGSEKNSVFLLDYLVSAYQINALGIEYYRDPYMFAMQSYLDSIVKGHLEYDIKIVGFLSKKLQSLGF